MNTIIGELGKSQKFIDLSNQIEKEKSPISISGLTSVGMTELVSAINGYNKRPILLVTYTERNSLRYREITAQSIQRMQILHRGIFMPAFDRILQLARMEEMDCEFVEVTAHEGARPTHAVWQGRVYHRGGAVVQDGERYEDFEAATGYGTGPGLCGWNCRHNFYPFYPGISVRNYTDERLAELDARNIPYGGGLYTRYEITQMQRVLERRVRGQQLLVEVDNADNGENVE